MPDPSSHPHGDTLRGHLITPNLQTGNRHRAGGDGQPAACSSWSLGAGVLSWPPRSMGPPVVDSYGFMHACHHQACGVAPPAPGRPISEHAVGSTVGSTVGKMCQHLGALRSLTSKNSQGRPGEHTHFRGYEWPRNKCACSGVSLRARSVLLGA